jgi:AcrR family transcriptional regulator
MEDPVAKKPRLAREDWIEAATQLLVKKSIDAVRVEPLAVQLGVSRGSFYWHFKSRQELLEAILSNWRERQTRQVVERIRENRLLSPEEQLTQLRMRSARSKASIDAAALELAIRAWARRDKVAKRAVQVVDAERVSFSEELLGEAGAAKSDARIWAYIGHAYILGESLLREAMTDEEIAACRSQLLEAQFRTFKEPKAAAPAKRARSAGGAD